MGKHDVIHKTGSTQYIALSSEEDRQQRPQVTCTENFVKCGRVVFEICEQKDIQTDTKTNRHTDTLIAILRTSHRGRRETIRQATVYHNSAAVKKK